MKGDFNPFRSPLTTPLNVNIVWFNRRHILPKNNAHQQEEEFNPIDDDTIIEQTSNTQNPYHPPNSNAPGSIDNPESYRTRYIQPAGYIQ